MFLPGSSEEAISLTGAAQQPEKQPLLRQELEKCPFLIHGHLFDLCKV